MQINVTAIELADDLIGEKGEFLVIYPDERIVIMTAVDAANFGLTDGGERPAKVAQPKKQYQPRKVKAAPKPIAPGEREDNGETKRVFFRLNGRQLSMPVRLYNVLEEMAKWTEPQKIGSMNDRGQASLLKADGYCELFTDSHRWAITAKGRDVVTLVSRWPGLVQEEKNGPVI
jgi:hypothetical protein